MKGKWQRASAVGLVLLGVLILGFSGCSKKEAAESPGAVKVREVVVGTGNAYNKHCFLDEKGELVGLELDILKAVDELLPEYSFKYETSEFKNILVGLETGTYDLAAHDYWKNAERAEKFLFAREPYNGGSYKVTVKAGRTDIQGVKDLEGKKLLVSAGSQETYLFESYNANSAVVPIDLVYGTMNNETQIKSLEEGRLDAVIFNLQDLNLAREAYNNRLEGVGPDLTPNYAYWIYRKGDEQLRDDVDVALLTLRKQGKLREFSIKWLGDDYSTLYPELEEQRLKDLPERLLQRN